MKSVEAAAQPGHSHPGLHDLEHTLRPLYDRLAAHPLYGEVENAADLCCFMESHVFAVWDFMSLLKALQQVLTCVRVPWTPSAIPESRRLVNEIVLGEESDTFEDRSASHFEIYLQAMEQAGANTSAIRALLAALAQGEPVASALAACSDRAAAEFAGSTFSIIDDGKPHAIAAAFTFGREDLIPELFEGFVRTLNRRQPGQFAIFLWYLQRHIALDGEEHGPMARRMVAELCGDDAKRWSEAREAAVFAVENRLRLWDGILASIRGRRNR